MENYVARRKLISEAYDDANATLSTSNKSKTRTLERRCNGTTIDHPCAKTTMEISSGDAAHAFDLRFHLEHSYHMKHA